VLPAARIRARSISGADANARNSNGQTPLYDANEKVANLLLATGCEINAANADGVTPLHYAARGCAATTKVLLASGANVDARNKDGQTPLHWATDKEVAELLLANGAEVNAEDNDGCTPLSRAKGLARRVWPGPWSERNSKRIEDLTEYLRQHGGHE
jgi:cytohesin